MWFYAAGVVTAFLMRTLHIVVSKQASKQESLVRKQGSKEA